jgi:hypothetical protein
LLRAARNAESGSGKSHQALQVKKARRRPGKRIWNLLRLAWILLRRILILLRRILILLRSALISLREA